MANPLIADGYGLDRALAAMFCGAKSGETVSTMAARAQVAGKPWGCVLCRFLSVTVERDHCTKALTTDTPTARPASYRAGAMLFLLAIALWFVPLWAWHLLTSIIHIIVK